MPEHGPLRASHRKVLFPKGLDIEQDVYCDSLLCCRGKVQAAYLNADSLKPLRVPKTLFEESKP